MSEGIREQPDTQPQIGEVEDGKNFDPRRKRGLGRTGLIFTSGVVVGAVLGVTGSTMWPDKSVEQQELIVNGGSAQVNDINRALADMHVTGFEATIPRLSARSTEVDRKLIGPIPLPDIMTESALYDEVIVSDLCLKGGKKDMTEQTIDGVNHVDYVIDPADISVCSREKPEHYATVRDDGNWITDANQASNNLNKIGKDVDTQERNADIAKANKLQSKLQKINRNLAILTVNKQCAPKVFDVTKDDLLNRVEDILGRDGEVFTARYDESMGEPAISGKSEMDAFFKDLADNKEPGIEISYGVDSVGSCELAPELLNERTQ